MQVKIGLTIQFFNMEFNKISNLDTFCAQLSDFWPYLAKIGNYRKREFGHLNFS